MSNQQELVDDRLMALTASLSIINTNSRAPVAEVVTRELSAAFGGSALAFRTIPGAAGWEIDFYRGADVATDAGTALTKRIHHRLVPFLQTAPTRWTAYDALRPEPAQRDRVVGPKEIQHMYETTLETSPVLRDVYEPLGLLRPSHIRVLVCDGPFLLAWLGIWRTEPLRREDVRRLGRIVAPLRRRMRIDRILDGSLSIEAVALALEAIAAPAFLVRTTGTLEFANEAGRILFERRGRSLITSIRAAMQAPGRTDGISVTPLQSAGLCARALVVLHGESESGEARLALATKRWNLTARQAEVLALLTRGDANKEIALKLRCAPRTVEIHVASLLVKAKAENRSQLVARFWSEV